MPIFEYKCKDCGEVSEILIIVALEVRPSLPFDCQRRVHLHCMKDSFFYFKL